MLGLVMEGGAMRGMFTAGVTDVLMEANVTVDGAIGTSAGAVFGCNVKSGQIGRVIRYNKRFCADQRYAGLRNLLLTGDLFGAAFCYEDIPDRLDPFDRTAFAANPMAFYAVCTDVSTGQAVYHRCRDGGREDMLWLRASASMPLAARPVEVAGYRLLDGGIADSIPLQAFQAMGYDRCIVILTQTKGFVKQPNRLMPVLRLALRRYPELLDALRHRHLRYNQTLNFIRAQERLGACLVLQPSRALIVGAVERNPNTLQAVYELGREVALEQLEAVKAFARHAKEGGTP